ncbi:MAG: AAA family ATPase [Nanoarchaeota archaeon]|nr:AAA family ATPase [Nanoarchaeota archaeon]
MNYFILGLPGSGKTTIGKLLANKLNFSFYDLDDSISDSFKERMEKGELVTENERDEFFQQFSLKLKELLKKDNYVISGHVAKEEHRILIQESCNDMVFIWLDVPIEELQNRLKKRKSHFFGESLLQKIIKIQEPIKKDCIFIDATKEKNQVIQDILLHIKLVE